MNTFYMIENNKSSPAAFIDRDGVINEDRGHVHRIEDFFFLPGAISGMQLLQEMGYKLVIITNQAGIAKGMYSEQDFELLNNAMIKTLSKNGIEISGTYYCPHHPSGIIDRLTIRCNCRKPNPGMIIKATKELNLRLENSILIGDNCSDINAGIKAGVALNILIRPNYFNKKFLCPNAAFTTNSMKNAVLWIKNRQYFTTSN